MTATPGTTMLDWNSVDLLIFLPASNQLTPFGPIVVEASIGSYVRTLVAEPLAVLA